MLIGLTPRHRPAKTIQSAISSRTLTDFGLADIIIAADSHPTRVDENFFWCSGRPSGADHRPLSAKDLLLAVPSPLRLPCEPLRYIQGAFGGILYESAQKRALLFSDRLALMPL